MLVVINEWWRCICTPKYSVRTVTSCNSSSCVVISQSHTLATAFSPFFPKRALERRHEHIDSDIINLCLHHFHNSLNRDMEQEVTFLPSLLPSASYRVVFVLLSAVWRNERKLAKREESVRLYPNKSINEYFRGVNMFVNCVLCEFASFSASNIQSLYINITYFIMLHILRRKWKGKFCIIESVVG